MKRFLIGMLVAMIALSSCDKDKKRDEPDVPDTPAIESPEAVEHVVMVYAVNWSSLAADFKYDSEEMLAALKQVDSEKCRLLIYYTKNTDECGLFLAKKAKDSTSFDFEEIVGYPRDVTSTDPDRISQVLKDALLLFPNARYDLVFWGHGTSWRPEFSDHTVETGTVKGYGGEYNSSGSSTDWTDIDELAAAVPDHRFETIWFDCCYMSGIENIYQLRNKCSYFVGYPTEVWQYGIAYDSMLPLLFDKDVPLTEAAKSFFDYYNQSGSPVTVAVIDMSKIEPVADCARRVFSECNYNAFTTGLINYSRMSKTPLYDFRQYLEYTAIANERQDLVPEIYSVMDEMVIYHAESATNFNFHNWNTENISGVSTHRYIGGNTPEDDYYRTLDWFNRVY